MGERWKDNSPEWNRDRKPHPSDLLYEVFTEGLGNFVSGTDNEIRREQFIRAHNADCADYEARIAELTAEVARVKAESLRVVVDGEERQAYGCSKVLHNGRICFVHTRTLDDYFPLQISDFVTGKYVDKVYCETLLQPVRLERWEWHP